MKKYILHIITLVLLTFFYGCSKEELQASFAPYGGSRTLTLTLTHAGMESRATSSPDGKDLNENLINRVDLFLYPAGGTGSNAVFSNEGITSFKTKEDGKVTIELEVPMEEFEDLFPKTNGTQATTCEAYVIVNRPTNSSIPSSTAMTNLKSISITSGFNTSEKQSEFVMDGYSNEITLSNDAIAGRIAAERSAAKITLTITNIEDVVENGVKWTPIPSGMQVMFYNGVKKSQVHTTSVPDDGTYFSLLAENAYGFTGTTSGETTVAPYNHTIPFYSYPSDWGETAKNKEAHMILMLPWTNGTRQDNFYYEVPIDDANKKLVRNTYYQISLVVGMLGSTELKTDEIVKLTPTCKLLNWGDAEINANLDQPRYLVVDKDVVKTYNKPNCSVEFDTSHDVTVQILSITKPNYTKIEASTDIVYTYTSGNPLSSTDDFTLTAENGVLNLYHELDNNINSSTFDYVPYTIKVRIWHTSAPTEYVEEIEFIQYPAVYVENSYNAGTTDIKNNNYLNDNSSGYGYVMVNTLYSNRYDYNVYNDGNKWQTVEGFDSSSKNPNMYIITTTALSSDFVDTYILGDSREVTEYTATKIGFTSITDVNNNTLQKYHPTKTDRNDYLSPKFRIASAYGQLGTNILTYQQAKNRCAAYQENGYPAGRWRLATTSELEYIARLCSKGAIPESLFGGSGYWSATQICTLNTSNGTISTENPKNNSTAWLRCVYDDWYWGSNSLKDKTKYTWGDEHTTEKLNAMASQQ